MRPRLSCGEAILSLAALLAPSIAAQDTWRIPPGGAAVFAAQEELEFFPTRTPRERPSWPVRRPPHVPMLLASEVADGATHLRQPARDVRWLAPALAFDLRHFGRAGKVDVLVPWLVPFGDVRVRGSAALADADGVQVLELKITSEDPPLRGVTREDLAHWKQSLIEYTVTGDLRIERHFDKARGAIDHLKAAMTLRCIQVKGSVEHTLRLAQNWQLTELRPNRGAEFNLRVYRGVQAAGKWLHQQLAAPSAARDAGQSDQTEGAGAIALALLALLHAEYSPNDTVVKARLSRLRRSELTETYPLSLAILVLEHVYAPLGERESLISGAIKASVPRKPSADDRSLLQQWTDRLLANRDVSVDRGYRSRWSYTSNGYDNSNSQFALFGLHAAQLCGIEVSRGLWRTAASHLLDEQCPATGKREGLQLVAHIEARAQPFPQLLRRSQTSADCRGFSYRGPEAMPYGSMTAGAISGLTLCTAHLQDTKAQELPAMDAAVRAAFKWLSKNRTLRVVPGDDAWHHDYWWYYWLYSLERACELSRISWIDDWDWYADGAELLLTAQQPDGSWRSNLVDHCFALLFLKQAQLPVLTGPRR